MMKIFAVIFSAALLRAIPVYAADFISRPNATASPSYVMIGGDSNWSTNALIRNTTGAPIQWTFGTFVVDVGGDQRKETSFINVPAGAIVSKTDLQNSFPDRVNRTWPVPDGLSVTTRLKFLTVANFEVRSFGNPLQSFSDHRDFDLLKSDPSNHYLISVVYDNKNDVPVATTIRVFDSTPLANGDFPFIDEPYIAPPGVTSYIVKTARPNGCSISVYLGSPGIGSGGIPAPLLVFAVDGPSDGFTQDVRYP